MGIYVLEGILAILSMIYYVLSKNSEWLVFVGLIIIVMAIERLITAIEEQEIEFTTTGEIEIFSEDMEWIRTDKALPPEPQAKPKEYNVITEHGEEATTLLYKGKGEWADPYGGAAYRVKLWKYLPEPPKEEEE